MSANQNESVSAPAAQTSRYLTNERPLELEIRQVFKSWPLLWMISTEEGLAIPPLSVKVPSLVIIAILSSLSWGVGAVVSAVLGLCRYNCLVNPDFSGAEQAFNTFATNLLGYQGVSWIFLGLLACRWFAIYFPRTLAIIAPAFRADTSAADLIRDWRKAGGLWWWILALITFITVAWIAAYRANVWWTAPQPPTLIASWMLTEIPLLENWLHGWYLFHSVTILPFIVTTGVVCILMSISLMSRFLRLPMHLYAYRRLNAVTDFSIGIGMWTLVGYVQIVLNAAFSADDKSLLSLQNFDPVQIFSLIAASTILILAFFIIAAPVREAVTRAKQERIAHYEQALIEVTHLIQSLESKTPDLLKDQEPERRDNALSGHFKYLEVLRTKQQDIEAQIKTVEELQAQPLTYVGVISVVSASIITPVVTALSEQIVQAINNLLAQFFPQP